MSFRPYAKATIQILSFIWFNVLHDITFSSSLEDTVLKKNKYVCSKDQLVYQLYTAISIYN